MPKFTRSDIALPLLALVLSMLASMAPLEAKAGDARTYIRLPLLGVDPIRLQLEIFCPDSDVTNFDFVADPGTALDDKVNLIALIYNDPARPLVAHAFSFADEEVGTRILPDNTSLHGPKGLLTIFDAASQSPVVSIRDGAREIRGTLPIAAVKSLRADLQNRCQG